MKGKPLKSAFAFLIALLLPGTSSAGEGRYTLDDIVIKIKSIPQLNQYVKKASKKKASAAGPAPVLELNPAALDADSESGPAYRDGYITYQRTTPNEPSLVLSYDFKFVKEKEYFNTPQHEGAAANSGLTQMIGLDYRVIMAGVKLLF